MAIPKEVVAKLDAASNAFDGVITKTEQKIFDSAVELIKKLDVDASGNIKMSTANLKVLSDIKSRLAQIASKDKAYLQGVKELAAEFDSIYKSQSAYYAKNFAAKTLNDKAKAKYEAMKRVAVTTTIDGLTGAGLQSNVLDPLAKTLLRAVTSGAKYADLVNELRNQLMTTDTGEGSLAKYAKTYATTALTQYAGQNNRLFTDDLGAEWFQYVGSEIETTREFCHHLTAKEFIHVSEIPDILAGKIEYDGKVHQCKMNPKTDLPYGLIEGTTPENFQVNVGGWNCRHQLVPVAKEAVPQDIRAKFDKDLAEERRKAEEAERLRKELEAKIEEARAAMAKVDGFKEYNAQPMRDAIASGDIPRMNELIAQANALYDKFNDLVLLGDARQYARDFTYEELRGVDTAVARTMSGMPSDLASRKSKLEFEIGWVKDHKKYPTWSVAKDAYERELTRVNNAIAVESVRTQASEAMLYASMSSSKIVKRYAAELNGMLSSDNIDIKAAQAKLKQLQTKIDEIKSAGLKPATSDEPQKCTPKTLEQLKEELGEQLPRTLSHLDSAISAYERSAKYGGGAKTYKKQIEQAMRRIFDEHDFGMNVDDNLLEQILDSWFKNTFEVGGGNGYVGSTKTTGKIETWHSRLGAAHKMFGIGRNLERDQLGRGEYEKYGNLLDHDILASMKGNPARQYGNVQIRFKKNRVLATWTPCDSLGLRSQPTLCSDPKACSYDDMSIFPKDMTNVKSFETWRRDHIYSYLELQYHGNLTPDCVESITFPYDITTSRYYNVAQRWQKAGAKIYYIKDGKLYRM